MKAEFRLRFFDEWVEIDHDKWSLIGVGGTLDDAVEDLVSEIYDFEAVMHDDPNSMLSDEAIRQRDFVVWFKKKYENKENPNEKTDSKEEEVG